MNGNLKNLALTAVLLTFSVSAYAAETLPAGNPPSETAKLMQLAMDQGSDTGTRETAVKALLANIENYQAADRNPNKGVYEDNLKARLKAIDSIWSLGEIGDPRLMKNLSKFYTEADDVIKMNLMISMGKLKQNTKAGPYLLNVAANPDETEVVRAIAFEMLEHIGSRAAVTDLLPSRATGIEKGDLIYTGGITGTISGWVSPDLPIGHAGVFSGTEIKNGKINVVIADCVPDNFKPGGVRNIYSWMNFTHHFSYPYYGNRTTPLKPTAGQRERIVKLALEMGRKGLTYSDTHGSQKGPLKFDCVGYTEFLYEAVGLNPTENSFETGWGWPLTPWEQFIATKPGIQVKTAAVQPDGGKTAAVQQSIITHNFNALLGSFGIKGQVMLPEVSTAITPEAVN